MMLQQDDDGCNAFAQDIIDSGGQGLVAVAKWPTSTYTREMWFRVHM